MKVNNPIKTPEEVIRLFEDKLFEAYSIDDFFRDFFVKFNNGESAIAQPFILKQNISTLNQMYYYLIKL